MVDQRQAERRHERRWVQTLGRSLKLCADMIIHIRNIFVASVLSVFAGFGSVYAQMGAGGPPPGGGQPGNSGVGGPGMSGREFVPPKGFTHTPGQDWPQPGQHAPPDTPPSRAPGDESGQERGVALHDAVSLVQERYNATAVKTDTVQEGGQLVYRIRLLSADRSRVWTVSVDARTGRIN